MDAAVTILGEAGIDNVYHVAFLVEDIDEGMEQYGAVFACEWAEPGHTTLPGTGGVECPITFTYSKGGPPFIELQVGLDDPECVMGFARVGGRPGGFHHVGIYAERWRDEVKRLEELGMTCIYADHGMAHLRHPSGLGVEVVSWKGRSWLHGYLARNGIDLAGRAPIAAGPS